jgi:hypothetical protein
MKFGPRAYGGGGSPVTCAGVFNPPSNEVALFEGSEGTSNHVLFIQSACTF